MPVPTRPRDFSLTEADAARLQHRRPRLRTIFGAGLRRSLGSSLAALGFVGLLATGSLSLFGGSATSLSAQSLTSDQNLAAVPAVPAASSESGFGKGAATAGPVSATAPEASPAFGPVASSAAGQVAVPTEIAHERATAAAAGAPDGQPSGVAPPGPQYSTASSGTDLGVVSEGNGVSRTAETESSSQSGMDSRLVWLGGFGFLFALGLLIVFLPLRPRGRGRGRP